MDLRNLTRPAPFLLIIATGVCLTFQAATAQTGSLRGFVADSSTGEALPFAHLLIAGTQMGTTTNARGYFFLPAVPPGKYTAVFSFVGYRSRRVAVTIKIGEITQVTARLVPAGIQVDEILVLREQERLADEAPGVQMISPQEIKLRPPSIESDIFRVLQSAPGVTTTGDVTAKYYVRGGSGDQNMVMLNGAIVYNPYHALGILSSIDPEMVSVMEFYRGGFPTQYAGRLSSILNITTRQGNENRFGAVAQASLLSGKLALEGPIPHGSILVTGRKSYYGEILKRYLGGQEYPFDFYDLSLSASYANPGLDPNGRFSANVFVSGDELENDDPLQEDYDIRNLIASVHWQKVWSSPLYSNASISYSGLRAVVEPNQSQARPRDNRVTDVSLQWNFGYVYQTRDELAFGAQAQFLHTELNVTNLYDVRSSLDESGSDVDLYGEYRFNRWESFALTLGLRIKLIALTQGRPLLLEPRATALYRFGPRFVLKAAVGLHAQQVVTLTDENELISIFEPWVIIPDNLAASQAGDFSAGFTAHLTDRFTVDVEGYFKPMTNLIETNPEKVTADDPDFINVDGDAYGLETIFSYTGPVIFGSASYALSWAYRYYRGERYYPRYDIRHAVNAFLGAQITENIRVSAAWSFRSGMPFTPIAGFYDRIQIGPGMGSILTAPVEPLVYWGDKNSGRLPTYHRLDLSAAWSSTIGSLKYMLELSLINVYDRKNIYYLDRDTGEEIYMLRFAPSVSLRVEL